MATKFVDGFNRHDISIIERFAEDVTWQGPGGLEHEIGSPYFFSDFLSDSSTCSRPLTLSLRYTRSEWNKATPFLNREVSSECSFECRSRSSESKCPSNGSILNSIQSVSVGPRSEKSFRSLSRSALNCGNADLYTLSTNFSHALL